MTRRPSQPLEQFAADVAARYAPYLLKPHGAPDVHSNHRMMCPAHVGQVDCTNQPADTIGTALPVIAPNDATNRPVCTNQTVSASITDYDVASLGGRGNAKPTYQPFMWQTPEWLLAYKPARSRIESVMGSLTGINGLHGGWRGFRVRGHANVTILATIAAATHNLRRQDHFGSSHGTPPRPPKRQITVDDRTRTRYLRTLAKRQQVRRKFRANPTRCTDQCAPVLPAPTTNGPP